MEVEMANFMPPSNTAVGPLPIQLAATQPEERDRLTVGLRLIWCIPQAIALVFVGIAAFVVAFIGWFGALFTGRLPEFAEEFLTGFIRWDARVRAYFYLVTDEYPPSSMDEHPEFPVRFSIPPRDRLNPLAVFFRIILVIPAGIVVGVVGSGALLIAFASWVMIVFTGSQPSALYEMLRMYIRFEIRVSGYFFMLTAEYPWGIMGDQDVQGDSAGDQSWRLTLTPSGRTTMIVAIVLGVVYELFTPHRL
jgi:hypothetical protein